MIRQNWFDRHLRKINWLLLALIVICNVYIVFTPIAPQVTYQVNKVIAQPVKVETPEQRAGISRDTDHLVIPSIGLDQKIWFGDNENLLHKGVWNIPHSSTPNKGSNTVLVGHRFSYKDPAVFYHLDKVNVGDPIVVAWQGKLYIYKVNDKKIVQPTDIYIEDQTEDDRLTLYTCHPLWSTRERLVVVAALETVE